MIIVHNQYLTGFASFERPNDTGYFKLIHYASGTVVTYRKFTLNKRCRTLLIGNNKSGCFFEKRIAFGHIYRTYINSFAFSAKVFRQIECRRVTLLSANVMHYIFNFGSIHKSTLYTNKVIALREKHISASDQLIGARRIQNCTRVDHRRNTKSNAGREVGFYNTGNNVYRRTLSSNDHVNSHCARQLGNACDWHFHFFTGCHYQIAKLIHNHNDVRQKTMPFFGIQITVVEFFVVFLDVPNVCFFK